MMKTIINADVGILLRTGVKNRMIDCLCVFIYYIFYVLLIYFSCRFIRDAFTAVRVAQCVHVCINGLPRTIISISGIVVVLLCALYCYYLGKCMVRIELALIV